jgi:hypothetical protein
MVMESGCDMQGHEYRDRKPDQSVDNEHALREVVLFRPDRRQLEQGKHRDRRARDAEVAIQPMKGCKVISAYNVQWVV